jgi:hypothetical protein
MADLLSRSPARRSNCQQITKHASYFHRILISYFHAATFVPWIASNSCSMGKDRVIEDGQEASAKDR